MNRSFTVRGVTHRIRFQIDPALSFVPDARICSYECTFCADCADKVFAGVCPNCGGDLQQRPTRLDR